MMTSSNLTHFQNSRKVLASHETEQLNLLFQIAGLGIFYLVFISLVPVMQATAMLNCYRLLEQLLLETRTTADVQRDLSTHRETM